jgi:hypothetical protein
VSNLGFLRKYRIEVAVKIGPAAIFVFTALRFSYRHRIRVAVRAPTMHVIYFTATVTATATMAVCANLKDVKV